VPAPSSQANSIFAIDARKKEKPAVRRASSLACPSYWTMHSMLEPALIDVGFRDCPKPGGGVT
jgi:hypothetical protein